MMSDQLVEERSKINWPEENQAYLRVHLDYLRLLLHRRVLWLRQQWCHDPLQSYQGLVISDAQVDRLLAGQDRHAEARFYQEDSKAIQIRRSITQAEQKLISQRQRLTEAGSPPALEVLVHLLSLTSFERSVLLLCLASELDPTFERIYAYLQDDVTRKYATPHMALTLFIAPSATEGEGNAEWDYIAARNSFLPEAPLRRFRLVTLECTSLSAIIPSVCPMRLDPRIFDYLRGVNRFDERTAELLRPMPLAPLSPSHRKVVDRMARALDSSANHGSWPILNLTGPPGIGKRVVARALSDHLGVQLRRLDTRRLPTPGPERQETLRLLEREAVLMQMALYLDAAESDRPRENRTKFMDDIIEGVSVFLIVGSQECWPTQRESLVVSIPKSDGGAQRIMWQQALNSVGSSLDEHIEAIVQQFDFGPEAIAQTVARAKGQARIRVPENGTEPTADDLWQACREQAGLHLNELAQRIEPCYTWEDIILPEDTFRQLQEIGAQVENRFKVYEVWDFGTKLSRGRGISALFSGPSGTGKTMAAEILASHLKLDLFRIDLACVVSKYIGETEKNLKIVFDAAEQSGAILFFDEADALFGKRSEVKNSHDRYANIEVNYLLQRMEDYRGLAILATNRKSALDQAFLRRLRFLVDFPFPNADQRLRIWQKVFPGETPVNQMEYAALARLEIPGGNIRNIALNAAFLAASEGGSVGMPHVMHSARREYAKIDKLITEAEFGSFYFPRNPEKDLFSESNRCRD
jgi:hypothetical protein